tara:strand:+ start:2123 stop:2560 length:438 start_codon:yes stop_codon:yes gene_type:complete
MVECNPSLIDDFRDTVKVNVIDTLLIPELIVSGLVDVSQLDTALITDIDSGIKIEIITSPFEGLKLESDTIPRFRVKATATIPRDTMIVIRDVIVPCPDPIVVDDISGSLDSIKMKIGIVGFVIGIITVLLILRMVKFVVRERTD